MQFVHNKIFINDTVERKMFHPNVCVTSKSILNHFIGDREVFKKR